MHHDQYARLNALNHQFYTKHAASFDVSRQTAWEGWLQLLPHLQTLFAECKSANKTPAILDIGCGNGRFLAFLAEHFPKEKCDYTGIDLSSQLLEKAATLSIPSEFSRTLAQTDVVAELERMFLQKAESEEVLEAKDKDQKKSKISPTTQPPSIFSRSFHLTVILGVMHHIPSYEYRKTLLEKALNNTTKDGLVIVTFWQFAHSKRLQNKVVRATPSAATPHQTNDLFENADFLLPWQDTPQARYAHHFSQKEIDQLKSELPPHTVVASFVADGHEQLNSYVILKKTE